jgi:hypothetical protein
VGCIGGRSHGRGRRGRPRRCRPAEPAGPSQAWYFDPRHGSKGPGRRPARPPGHAMTRDATRPKMMPRPRPGGHDDHGASATVRDTETHRTTRMIIMMIGLARATAPAAGQAESQSEQPGSRRATGQAQAGPRSRGQGPRLRRSCHGDSERPLAPQAVRAGRP